MNLQIAIILNYKPRREQKRKNRNNTKWQVLVCPQIQTISSIPIKMQIFIQIWNWWFGFDVCIDHQTIDWIQPDGYIKIFHIGIFSIDITPKEYSNKLINIYINHMCRLKYWVDYRDVSTYWKYEITCQTISYKLTICLTDECSYRQEDKFFRQTKVYIFCLY